MLIAQPLYQEPSAPLGAAWVLWCCMPLLTELIPHPGVYYKHVGPNGPCYRPQASGDGNVPESGHHSSREGAVQDTITPSLHHSTTPSLQHPPWSGFALGEPCTELCHEAFSLGDLLGIDCPQSVVKIQHVLGPHRIALERAEL